MTQDERQRITEAFSRFVQYREPQLAGEAGFHAELMRRFTLLADAWCDGIAGTSDRIEAERRAFALFVDDAIRRGVVRDTHLAGALRAPIRHLLH